MKIEHFEDIEGWKLGRKLANLIYDFTSRPPFSMDFGLRDQIQRAAGSVMHNIAEGFDAGSNPEFVRFFGYSKRSCTEVQSELYLASDRGISQRNSFAKLINWRMKQRRRSAGLPVIYGATRNP